MINIAILGHGVVGSGVAEVIATNAESIARRVGEPVEVRRILDLRSFPDLPYADRFTTQFEDIVSDPTISVVVETMGGLHPAYDFVKACLEAGKSVATSNKELVAAKGDELLALAEAKNLNFLFEASVGGGIPIIRPLAQCLAANRVEEIAGILNGTTNFMLTRMVDDGMSFDEALQLAQSLGYAERNPAADVEGADACRKICILASLAFGYHVYPEQVYTEGITALTVDDMLYARALDCVVKLIGRAVPTGDGVSCLVAPMLVPKSHLLADIHDVFNGVLVRGNAVDDVVFYGRGAGKLPTASAVVADVMDAVMHREKRRSIGWAAAREGYVADARTDAFAYLLRFAAADRQGLLNRLQEQFGDLTVVTCPGRDGELAVRTAPMSENCLQAALAALPDVTLISRLRFADF